MRKLFLFFLCWFLPLPLSAAFNGEARVIRVNGLYGIIDKGLNQGVTQGQRLFVKRRTATGLVDVGTVKVIRSTANRGAVKQVSEEPFLRKGDVLFAEASVFAASSSFSQSRSRSDGRSAVRRRHREESKAGVDPYLLASNERRVYAEGSKENIPRDDHTEDIPIVTPVDGFGPGSAFRQPWVSLQMGTMFPTGSLSGAFSPSYRVAANYMVSVNRHLNVGLEVSRAFLSNLNVGTAAGDGVFTASGSFLQGLVVLQTFFGRYIFFEAGGGVYRPEVKTLTRENVESRFSSTHFGLFGGLGVFVPTSPYAGFAMKGRIHNYFDDVSRQYYGIGGGFRFRLNGYK